MFRLAISIGVACSAILFIAVIAFWIRGYRVSEHIIYVSPHVDDQAGRAFSRTVYFGSCRPGIGVHEIAGSGLVLSTDRRSSPNWSYHTVRPASDKSFVKFIPAQDVLRFAGFIVARYEETGQASVPSVESFRERRARHMRGIPTPTYTYWARRQSYVVPYWFLALCTGLLPAVWVRHRIRRRRALRTGCCVYCGYDLRGSPDQCPECGRRASPASAVPA
jgi:hypothetical protein